MYHGGQKRKEIRMELIDQGRSGFALLAGEVFLKSPPPMISIGLSSVLKSKSSVGALGVSPIKATSMLPFLQGSIVIVFREFSSSSTSSLSCCY